MSSSLRTINIQDSYKVNRVEFFGLSIYDVNYNILRDEIYSALEAKRRLIINYVNANSIRLIQKNKDLRRALNVADICHQDGVGIWLGSKLFKSAELNDRFNFTDCAMKMLYDFQSKGLSIFFIGSTNDMLKRALQKIKSTFPKLKVVGSLNGFDDIKSGRALEIINDKKPDILWVGMGTPAQELWIFENKSKLDCGVIQSVGDLITFLAGKKPRGPLILQRIGLEWLIRFLRHPIKYFDRYIIGVPLFLYFILKEYFTENKY
jgi:N-acetylglucosaminyldiphosphoundecaprenol N-acetyl-beta-D-mannosaminyltransferase